MTAHSLPLELIIQIGSFLPKQELCNLSLACKETRRFLLRDIFQGIVIHDDNVSDVESFFGDHEDLKTAVHHISLDHMGIRDQCPNYDCIARFPSVKSVRMMVEDSNSCQFKDLPSIVAQVARMPAIECATLHLSSRWTVTSDAVTGLIPLPPLKRLHIAWDCDAVSETVYIGVIERLISSSQATLTSFTFGNEAGPYVHDIQCLRSMVDLMPNVKELSLLGPAIGIMTFYDVDELLQSFQSLSKLETLSLGCDFTEDPEDEELTGSLLLAATLPLVECLSMTCLSLRTFTWDNCSLWDIDPQTFSCRAKFHRDQEGTCSVRVTKEAWMSDNLCGALGSALVAEESHRG